MIKQGGRTLLIIDDDRLFCEAVIAFFKNAAFTTVSVQTGRDGLTWCSNNRADVVLLDQKLPDSEGLQLCQAILGHCEQAKIIFITAYPSFDHAVQALRNGAHDYLSKPMELEELQLAVERAFRTVELERVEQLQQLHISRDSRQNKLIGRHGGLRAVNHLVELAAANQAPVLITGETGTGKNVVAKAIHYFHDDHAPSFVDANCAALPENLIESELFGHERGSFTGALSLRKGLFEMAEGGTLFLDEIGEIPLHLQAKLLGILDNGVLRRIGSQTARKIDVRIIAATNIDLEQAVIHKTFREDLYYRLSVMRIHMPPLCQRREDIAELSRYFLKEIAPDQNLTLPPEELHAMKDYPWPGNVRELRNILERAIILRTDKTVHPAHLLAHKPDPDPAKFAASAPHPAALLIKPLVDMEKEHIRNALTACADNHTHAAAALGIARSTLLRKIEQHRLKPGDSK
ncbi:MAG: sigma-54 dependent transcriptional regulator [Proteobacteria bacterium]|nr:sigma-54 dependent transcriptional regulator [Pseudomonadota bacterium]